MTKKYNLKNNIILDLDEDENETVDWLSDEENEITEYFDCGCCDDCLCEDDIECSNCGCNCNSDEYYTDIEDEDDDCLSNFNIDVIRDENNEKKVRITLQLNVILDNKKKEVINIDLDINSNIYLKIAEELFN